MSKEEEWDSTKHFHIHNVCPYCSKSWVMFRKDKLCTESGVPLGPDGRTKTHYMVESAEQVLEIIASIHPSKRKNFALVIYGSGDDPEVGDSVCRNEDKMEGTVIEWVEHDNYGMAEDGSMGVTTVKWNDGTTSSPKFGEYTVFSKGGE